MICSKWQNLALRAREQAIVYESKISAFDDVLTHPCTAINFRLIFIQIYSDRLFSVFNTVGILAIIWSTMSSGV